MTPLQLILAGEAFVSMREAEQERTQANIYLLSSLIRTAVWGKRLPKYDRLFKKEEEPKPKTKTMTDRQLYDAVLALNAAFGGSVEE